MTIFQLLMLGASAFFAYKIYEHIQTLKDPNDKEENNNDANQPQRTAKAFSTFNASSLMDKADEALENKELDKALAIYSEANIKKPDSADTLFKMGYTLGLQERDEEALEYYKEALALDKNNTFIYQAMASIYRKKGEYTSARMSLNASLDIDDANPITYYNYGNLLQDMKRKEEAMEMYAKAIEMNPDFSQAKEELKKLEDE